jgi:predicted small lipoprotein YifL
MNLMRVLILLLAAGLLTSGCGTKGPLYLPKPDAASQKPAPIPIPPSPPERPVPAETAPVPK